MSRKSRGYGQPHPTGTGGPHPAAATLEATARLAADRRAPGVTLGAPGKESVRNGRLHLFATSDESATGAASGSVRIPALGRRYRLRPAARALSPSSRTRIRVRIPRKALRAIRAGLARHEKLEARIAVGVSDGPGNATTKALTIRLEN